MRVVCTEQHTHEWYKSRLGIPTGSSVWRAFSFLKRASKTGEKGASSATRNDYMMEKAIEIITGEPAEHFVSKAMDKGTEYEPKARSEYMFINDVDGDKTGFILHPSIDRFGTSPDLVVLPDGSAEFKCPLPTTHAEYLRTYWQAKKAGLTGNDLALAVIPEAYRYQCDSVIACCEVDWCDWCSYAIPAPEEGYPVFPENLRMLQVRLYRDEARLAELTEGVNRFNEELLELVEDMRQMHNGALPGSKLQQQLRESL